ncbi:MAG: DnaJ domain-containing protein [Terriglobia bacterium]
MPDHYTLLGVARSATTKEIKVAYRRLVAQYHPDLNPDPGASGITATLNEAYAVLSDEGKRKAYDAELDLAISSRMAGAESSHQAASAPAAQTYCQNCDRQDNTLRFSEFWSTLSFILVTRRRIVSGVWCEKCRVAESAKWSLLSGFGGWWGIPWGPIRTIQDLAVNSRGGRQPESRNAALLRSIGYELYGRGNYDEAFRALQQSLRFKPDAEANALLDHLQSRLPRHAPEPQAASFWALALVSPALVVAVIWAGLIYAAASRLGGYPANHQASSTLTLPSPVTPSLASDREMVKLQVKHLATVIAIRSPRIGSHYEGSTLVADYGLDRSRYNAAQLYPIAQSIGTVWKAGTPDPNGFLASAYFNSMLFALSVDIVNRIYRGNTIEVGAAQAEALGADPRVSAWLRASRFWPGYQALETTLQAGAESYKPGPSLEEMETQAELIETTLQQLESQQRLFQAEEDVDAYNRLVPVYNRDLAHLKSLSHQIQTHLALANKLDQAFNRCLDGSILLSKLEHVNLTSGASKINTSP